MGWTQIVSDGLNRTSMIEPKSAELMASIEIKARDLPGSTREQFGSAAVLIYIQTVMLCQECLQTIQALVMRLAQ